MQALAAFGAPMHQVTAHGFTSPTVVFQIGVVPRRIDLLTSISGVEFDEACLEHIEVDIEGISVPVISRRLLIQNKRSTGRQKDDLDVNWLEENPE